MIKIVVNNLRRNKRRTVLTLLGIIIGVTAIISLVSVSVGLTRTSGELLSSFQGIFVFEEDAIDIPYSEIDTSLKSKLENVPGVDLVLPEVWTNPSSLDEEFQTTEMLLRYSLWQNIVPLYG